MPAITILLGILLAIAGFIGYFATEAGNPTTLIPSAFGFMMIALGILARNESLRGHALHGAAAIGLLGFFGSVSGLWQLWGVLMGAEAEPAILVRSLMAVVCLVYVALAISSFLRARSAKALKR